MEDVCPKYTLQKIQDRLFKNDKELKKKKKKEKDKEWHKENVEKYLIKIKSK